MFQEEIVVSAYLYVGSGIDSLFLNRSMDIGLEYTPEAAAISNAIVKVSVDGRTYQLLEYDEPPGVYFLPEDSLVIESGKLYELEAIVGDKTIRASTLAPDPIHIDSLKVGNSHLRSSFYLGPKFTIYWSETEGAEGYLIATISDTSNYRYVDIGFL
ncbi:MAG: DUF4249 family protein, partial [Fidelibacterota bacterium]